MTQLKLFVLCLFAFLVAVFAVSNQQSVAINFFNRPIITDVSLIIIVLGAVLIGVLFAGILGFMAQSKLKKELAKEIKEKNMLKGKEEKLQLKIRDLEEKLEDEEEGKREEPAK